MREEIEKLPADPETEGAKNEAGDETYSLWSISNWAFVAWLMEMIDSSNETADEVAAINPVVPW